MGAIERACTGAARVRPIGGSERAGVDQCQPRSRALCDIGSSCSRRRLAGRPRPLGRYGHCRPPAAVAPVDSPGVPLDLAAQLADAALREDRQLASVHDGERLQPAFLLLHRDLSDALLKAVAGPIRRLGAWVQAQGPALVDARTHGWVSALRGANDATEFAALEAVMKDGQETGDGG